jgi:hypothetical protein
MTHLFRELSKASKELGCVQARNELLCFPFRLARGEDRHEEPVELRLLMLLHDAARRRLSPHAAADEAAAEDDPFADAEGVGTPAGEGGGGGARAATTEEVVCAGVERLAVEGYGEALERVLERDGRRLGRGLARVRSHDLKRACKQVTASTLTLM